MTASPWSQPATLADVIAENHAMLRSTGLFSVGLLGSSGSGKTTLVEFTGRRLAGALRVGAIVANPAALRDAERLVRWCRQVVPLEVSHLSPLSLHEALHRLDLSSLDLLFLEIGGVESNGSSHLGHTTTVGLFSVSGGDDKAAEYPAHVTDADLLLLTKIDLLLHVPFNLDSFRRDVQQLKPGLGVLELSALEGDGMEPWLGWLKSRCWAARARASGAHLDDAARSL